MYYSLGKVPHPHPYNLTGDTPKTHAHTYNNNCDSNQHPHPYNLTGDTPKNSRAHTTIIVTVNKEL